MTRCASGQTGHIAKAVPCVRSLRFQKEPAHSKLFRVDPPSASSLTAMAKSSGKRRRRLVRTQPTAYDPKAQLETEKNGCIRAQNEAYDKWHGICGEKAILFDWDQFVAVASKEMGESLLAQRGRYYPRIGSREVEAVASVERCDFV